MTWTIVDPLTRIHFQPIFNFQNERWCNKVQPVVGEPANHDDLQSLVLDALSVLQRRLKDSQTNGILPYWNGENPHNENDCRDRIVEYLELALQPYRIRSYIESAMPDNNRCDIMNSFGELNLPIEIKGQWHPRVWERLPFRRTWDLPGSLVWLFRRKKFEKSAWMARSIRS